MLEWEHALKRVPHTLGTQPLSEKGLAGLCCYL